MTFLTQKMRPSECVIQSETHSDVINLGINLDFYSSYRNYFNAECALSAAGYFKDEGATLEL